MVRKKKLCLYGFPINCNKTKKVEICVWVDENHIKKTPKNIPWIKHLNQIEKRHHHQKKKEKRKKKYIKNNK